VPVDIQRVYRLFFRAFRPRRMAMFERLFAPTADTRILDLGGEQAAWVGAHGSPRVTVLNIHPPENWDASLTNTEPALGDATALDYADDAFDIVFSNSVIEHVGSPEKQRAFAAEVRRVGRAYFVQTPAREFLVDPHYLTPFVHRLPKRLRKRLLRNFSVWGLLTRPSQEYVDGSVDEISLLSGSEMRALFPDAVVIAERFAGLTKAWIAVRPRV
jgi:nucleotide-binding universal stress UspA family protein